MISNIKLHTHTHTHTPSTSDARTKRLRARAPFGTGTNAYSGNPVTRLDNNNGHSLPSCIVPASRTVVFAQGAFSRPSHQLCATTGAFSYILSLALYGSFLPKRSIMGTSVVPARRHVAAFSRTYAKGSRVSTGVCFSGPSTCREKTVVRLLVESNVIIAITRRSLRLNPPSVPIAVYD